MPAAWKATPILGALLALACTGPTPPGDRLRPGPQGPSAAPPSARPSTATQASASLPQPTGAVLPGRLGLALPRSLVGAQAQARLAGEGGLVAAQGSQIQVLADGRIVSNNSGALVSDQGGGIVSNHSGAAVGGPGGAWRLAQADSVATLAVTNPANHPKMQLWLVLALVDLTDQLLQAFLQAQPRVGQWKRFPGGEPKLLPLPVELPLFQAVSVAFTRLLSGLHYAGHLSQGADGLRLRIVSMPEATTPLAQATPVLDLQSSGPGAVARNAFMPELLRVFGFTNASARVGLQPGPTGLELEALVAEASLEPPAPGSLQTVLNPNFQDNTLRRVRLRSWAADSAQALVASRSRVVSLDGAFPPRDRRNFLAIGYDPSQASSDRGLVAYKRESFHPVGEPAAYLWLNPLGEARPASQPLWPFYCLPDGTFAAQGPAELSRLLRPFEPTDEALMPHLPAEGEDPSATPALRPDPLGPDLLAAPESP